MPRSWHMIDTEKNPSGYLLQSHQVLKLIEQHPELPLLFKVSEEGGDCVWTEGASGCVCSSIHARLGEVLDCAQQINDEVVYIDRREFMEDLIQVVYDTSPYDDRPDSYYAQLAGKLAEEYEPYWRKCIIITLAV